MTEHYPWKVIDPKDYIQVEARDSLTLKDVHVLTRLYQPIIGGPAYALYQLLFASLDFQATKKSTTISELLTKLDVGIPDFYQARVKLEGIGLIRIYRSNDEPRDYYYELIPPLSAEGFFKDSLLRTMLIEKVGERLFQEEWDTFIPTPDDKFTYEETTRSFLDVYHVDLQRSSVLNKTDFMPFDTPKRPKLVETIENIDSFDYKFFKAGLNKHFIKRESLNSELKDLIYTYHVMYGIDEMTMQQLILESADVESGTVNPGKFTHNVQRNFTNKQKITTTPDEMTPTVEVEKGNFTVAESQIIQHAKATPPADYLSSIKEQKGGFVTSNEQWVLKELVERSPLTKEVVNILLNYILVGRENPVLEKNYTMKIANDWAQSGVRSAEAAMAKIKEMYTQPKAGPAQQSGNRRSYNRNYQQPKRQGKLPDWAKDENIGNAAADELVSAEESESFHDRLERLRKLREDKGDK